MGVLLGAEVGLGALVGAEVAAGTLVACCACVTAVGWVSTTQPAGVAVLTTGVLVGDGVWPQAKVITSSSETARRIANFRSVMAFMSASIGVNLGRSLHRDQPPDA